MGAAPEPAESAEIGKLIEALATQRDDPRALARALSWVENRDPRADAVLSALAAGPRPPASTRFGFTGAPGVGKSSVIANLIPRLREKERRVAVLAVDPTSPISGGALLGDRVRMDRHGFDAGVFIRSVATRSGVGGLAAGTDEAAQLLEYAGYDIILIETVGVGQLELEIVEEADRVYLLVSPESGDTMQFLKGGMMEVVSGLIVNKNDRPGADGVGRLAQELCHDRGLPDPVKVSAQTQEGLDELAARLCEDAESVGEVERAARQRRRWVRRLSRRAETQWLQAGWKRFGGRARVERLAEEILAGSVSVLDALARLEKGAPPSETGGETPDSREQSGGETS